MDRAQKRRPLISQPDGVSVSVRPNYGHFYTISSDSQVGIYCPKFGRVLDEHRLREKTASGTLTSLQGPRWAGHEHARTRKLIRAVNGLARRGQPRTAGCQASNVDARPHHDQGRHHLEAPRPDPETGRTLPR